MAEAGAQFRSRLAGFLRTLRANGFVLGIAEVEDALRLMAQVPLNRPVEMRGGLRALLCARPADWQRFDELFDAHWSGRGVKRAAKVSGQPARGSNPLRRFAEAGAEGRPGAPDHAERTGDGEEPADGRGRRQGASTAEALGETDLRHIVDPETLARARALAERLARRMRYRLTRRERLHAHGSKIDLRRTIHRSIARGGVPMDLAWRRRRDKPLRLVVLLDVSGSMSQYSAVFLRFVSGILDRFRQAEAFVFHTRLIHISAALRERDAVKAVERLSLMAGGWGGGTKIGESLAAFNRWHAARVVQSRTAVIIVSDGYDTGAPEALAAEMDQLRRRTKRIVWLNPMLGWPGYEPTAVGMAAALPYVDLFAPAHSLSSLEALEPYLAEL